MADTSDETVEERIEQIAPGLYVVHGSTEKLRRISPLSDEKLEELIGPIESEAVKRYVRERYRAATRPRRRWFDFLRLRCREPDTAAA
jgi:hypothetical protein